MEETMPVRWRIPHDLPCILKVIRCRRRPFCTPKFPRASVVASVDFDISVAVDMMNFVFFLLFPREDLSRDKKEI
jgi:hypothetical protein